MSHIQVKSERLVNASPETIYAILSDYVSKRPQILTPNFMDYSVEKGGRGKGTVVRYRLHAANRERDYRLRIDEPIKGQIITEHDTNSTLINTWTLSPLNDGTGTRVSVISEWEGGSGVKGFFERTFAPLGLKSIYGKILGMLNLLVAGEATNEKKNVFNKNTLVSRLGFFSLVFGVIIGIAFIIKYLPRKKS